MWRQDPNRAEVSWLPCSIRIAAVVLMFQGCWAVSLAADNIDTYADDVRPERLVPVGSAVCDCIKRF